MLRVVVKDGEDLKNKLHELVVLGGKSLEDIEIESTEKFVLFGDNEQLDEPKVYSKFTYGLEGLNPTPKNLGSVSYEAEDGSGYYRVDYLLNEAPDGYKGVKEIVDAWLN